MATLPSTKYKNQKVTVSGTVNLIGNEVEVYCNTSSAPVTLNLLDIPVDYWSNIYTLYVKDASTNASTNNITIVAPTGFKINNQQSIVINVNDGCAFIKIASNVDYVATLNYGIVGTNSVIVNNTVYVMKNGSDTTGLVQRFDKPFLTIEAATNAALVAFTSRTVTNRVRIVVESGNYVDVINLYDFIDYDLGNSVITAKVGSNCVSDRNGTFSAVSTLDYNVIIYGNATFISTNKFASGTYAALKFEKAKIANAGKFLMSFNSAISTYGEALYVTGGTTLTISALTLKTLNNAEIGVNTVRIDSQSLPIQNANVIRINNCNITNSASDNYIPTICCTHGLGVDASALVNKLMLSNCQISNLSIPSPAIATVSGIFLGNLTLTLINTIIYCSTSSPSVSKGNASSALNMYTYNSYSNQAEAGGGLAPTAIYGALNVDAAIIVNQGQPI